MRASVAMRFEGGLGDHILGMRLLYFVRKRFPTHRVVAYCDCGGFRTQLQIAALSPYVDEVIPVFQDRSRVNDDNLGALENIREEDLSAMKAADVFVDAWPGPLYHPGTRAISPGSLYLPQSKQLGVSYVRILATRPRLRMPQNSGAELLDIIEFSGDRRYVAINFDKLPAAALRFNFPWIRQLLLNLLEDSRVHVLNIFSSDVDFPHLPEAMRVARRKAVIETSKTLAEMRDWNQRIIPVVDKNILTVIPLLKRCSYFIGLENGMKHLAWALNVPRTFFVHEKPRLPFILRWMPDYHSMVLIDDFGAELSFMVQEVCRTISLALVA